MTPFRFSRDFDYRVDFNTEVSYKSGSTVKIPDAHAEAALAAGAGERVTEAAGASIRSLDTELKAEDKTNAKRR